LELKNLLGYILLFIHLFPHREIGGGFLVLGHTTDFSPDPVKYCLAFKKAGGSAFSGVSCLANARTYSESDTVTGTEKKFKKKD